MYDMRVVTDSNPNDRTVQACKQLYSLGLTIIITEGRTLGLDTPN